MSDQTSAEDPESPKRFSWLGFTGGSAIVFTLMALLWPVYFYDGYSVREVSLGRYYLLEIQLAFTSPQSLGPTSGGPFAAVSVLAEHLVISVAGGLIIAVIGWLRTRRSTRDRFGE